MSETSPPILFAKYAYGSSRKDLANKISLGPCADAPDNRLLACAQKPMPYLDQDWDCQFNFNNLDELQQIILSRKEQPKLNQMLEVLEANAWQPVFAEMDRDALDLLAHGMANATQPELEALDQFAQKARAAASPLTIYCFPAAHVAKICKNGKKTSYDKALDKAPENFVMLALMLDNDYLKLAFTAPLLARKNALRYGQYIRKD